MAGPITEGVLLRIQKFKAYQAEIVRILTQVKRDNAFESKDAGLLVPDWNFTKLLKKARDALTAHAARRDNPHQETMETIGSYSATAVNAKLAAKVPNSVLPLSTYGVIEFLTAAQVAAAWVGAGWVVSCNRTIKIILSGTPYTMPTYSLDLRGVEASPGNKTFNVYVRARFGKVTYEARVDSPPESVSVMFIGTVTTNASGIASLNFAPVTRIDTFRLSTTPLGSVIPVTGGTIDAPTKFPSTWNPL